jgi:3-oxoacyl-(acyl-carrier-protein) synthase/3-hydroxymyristoyl/3-hydroxydecanoyl-(acyl carrier protein) dehydratase
MREPRSARPFGPIAIVGRGCVVPGAFTPAALWDVVRGRRCALRDATAADYAVHPARAASLGDEIAHPAAGLIDGFDHVFEREGFGVAAPALAALDVGVRWLLHAARAALDEARVRIDAGREERHRRGVIIGNLSYPTRGLTRYALSVWGATQGSPPAPDPRLRFVSALPARALADAVGFGEAFALDAACASSLYAIKYACDRLNDDEADLMLAGGLNAADVLCLHTGFTALKALSPNGRSRPFHPDADGLVPGQGAVLFALKRLADVGDDDVVHGIIRGVGLSNDGRGPGLLVPSREGQLRSLRSAYASSGVAPSGIDFVECHATGTATGDAVELDTLRTFFGAEGGPPIGSLKGNLGHLLTAAGGAGLLKILLAMEAGVLPPSCERAHDPGDDPRRGGLEVVAKERPWIARGGARRAAVSAFGFGGNNAHLIVERPEQAGAPRAAPRRPERLAQPAAAHRVAVVGLSVIAGQDAPTTESFAIRWAEADPRAPRACATIDFDAASLGTPPADLRRSLPQQLLFAKAALALDDAALARLPRDRTALYVGMQCDAEAARFALRWRCETPPVVRGAERLTAADVVGCMPNVIANRLGRHWDLHGPSAALSADAHSGLTGLALAARALASGEIDAAIVGAVDLCAEDVHRAAYSALAPAADAPCGDAAVALILKRVEDAARDGDAVLGIVDLGGRDTLGDAGAHVDGRHVARRFGHAQAAHGLLAMAAGLAKLAGAERVVVTVSDQWGATQTLSLRTPNGRASPLGARASTPDGRRALPFEVPAHWESPRGALAARANEAPRTSEAADGPEPEWMEPAPSIPFAMTSVVEAPVPGPSVAPSPIAVHQARLAELHRSFLHHQFEANRQFLRLAMPSLGREGGAPEVVALTEPPSLSLPPGASSSRAPTELAPLSPEGPTFDRAALEVHAAGRISSIFGPMFVAQDRYPRQCRMPEPPLLLADRVTGLRGEPGTMGKGTIWTETDVRDDSWYLHEGRVPPAVMVEAGQADLMLISWLGADLLNKGDRVYRLLGCDLVCHGELARPGDTLRYEIHVDGHARQGDVRLFFFHYDCRVGDEVRLSVRNGQAGFFTDEELRESRGILWDPRTDGPTSEGRVEPPRVTCERRSFTAEQVRAFAAGEVDACFGPAFTRARTHTCPPTIQGGRMLLLDEVEAFEPDGGPWGRGYLRASLALRPDHWFFDGHFKGDPCMPGTLMLEGCLQAMAIYLTGLGHTLDKDGWLFAPVPETVYRLQCRGQATPSSRKVTYEVFVDELVDGTLFADILGSVDGLKAFYCKRMGLRLVPGWPLDRGRRVMPPRALPPVDAAPPAVVDGVMFDQAAVDACAWGRPTAAFGSMMARFDAGERLARLPGPPYHFMSRVRQVRGPMGGMEVGSSVVADYDVPADAWYFAESGASVMPLAALMEVALQPCGWLACYVGTPITRPEELCFRNLDGRAEIAAEVRPDVGTLTVAATLTQLSSAGSMVIVTFRGELAAARRLVCTFETVFGFFPSEAMRHQPGLPLGERGRAALDEAAPLELAVDERGPTPSGSGAQLPTGRLRMLHRITGLWTDGGRYGHGRIRGERDVDADDWYFKAHFFQDPVQPGSLGMEAMRQALQIFLLETVGEDVRSTHRFEGITTGAEPVVWKYRGQVLPEDALITVDLDVTARGVDERGPFAWAEGSLWVGDKRIYEASSLGARLVPLPGAWRGGIVVP